MSVPRTGTFDFPRVVRASDAASLRALGLTYRQIADRMGISRSYASSLINDPTGAAERERKDRYRGVCEDCGGPTTGGDGRALAPKVCLPCFNRRRRPEHGTHSRYNSGCPCDACREANRVYHRSLKDREAPNHGTESGYVNYRCRCSDCTEAHRQTEWLRYDLKKRRAS